MNVINFTNNHKNVFLKKKKKTLERLEDMKNSKFNNKDLILRIF